MHKVITSPRAMQTSPVLTCSIIKQVCHNNQLWRKGKRLGVSVKKTGMSSETQEEICPNPHLPVGSSQKTFLKMMTSQNDGLQSLSDQVVVLPG